jgi:hypothetical protein
MLSQLGIGNQKDAFLQYSKQAQRPAPAYQVKGIKHIKKGRFS